MLWPSIEKKPHSFTKPPNLSDYASTVASFSWDTIRAEFQGLPESRGFNIAHEAVDRHAGGDLGDHVALLWLGSSGTSRTFTYSELKAQSNRFANILLDLGIGKGDTAFVLAGRIPELYIAALGILKNTSVFCPLFSAFGPEPVFQRLSRGDAKILLTTEHYYRRKVSQLIDKLPLLQYVLLTDIEDHQDDRLRSLPRLMAEASETYDIPSTDPEDIALLHFTSGTTGMPKGALHAHSAALTHYMTGKYVMDFHKDDVFWCTADPGWVTGTSYGIISPLLHGITNIVDEAEFDPMRWCDILASRKVSVWYTAPTAIRRFMRLGIEPVKTYDLSNLRLIHSVGEPLNPEAVVWGMEAMGLPIHDNWWQTETGGIMIANFPAMEIRPGSMGRPLPGIEAAVVRHAEGDAVEVVEEAGIEGDLALRPGWPSMFRGYLHDEERYRKCFAGGWYLTGDLAKRDADGYFWFVGRADDIIKTSGHMVSPFEVESTLMEHPTVAEVGVIGKPDPLIGEIVKAFVALKPDIEPSDALHLELIGFARQRLGSAVAPKEIEFKLDLPKNKAGKIMRRLLKARELGLPEGDLSTLENPE
ncbi:acetate--CoA ligase [Desulfopila inferna]|uniref:acetate--CoA ligase n=1 Tax=Desulfopila inferna TaxID=468528 RepID=UPI001963FB8E|nr:acetate--CoA ligase [Desulfopila inferna]